MPEVDEIKHVVRAYILQATEVEKSALPVKLKETAEFAMPEESKKKLEELPALENAFYALTPGRQRGYLLHFTTAKQSKTRAARVQRCMARILDGKGLDD
jgi:uncharacterized protein YdeI (YjbR/CyaY-like superfamily)